MRLLNRGYSCVYLLVILGMLCSTLVQAQTPDRRYDDYMDAVAKLGAFNGYVLVAREGKPVFSRGVGMADFEQMIPNSAHTKYRIASITKTFTAAAIMMLQEKGKLNVGDPVCKYLTECSHLWRPLTLRNLLGHTSGIPGYTSDPQFMARISIPTTPSAIIASVRSRPLQFEPGSSFAYSNTNYILLGQIIEKVSGRTYAQFLRANIMAAAGMNDTGYDGNKRIKQRAIGYRSTASGVSKAPFMDVSNAYSAGGLYSTPEDLVRWDQALSSGKILSKSSIEEMFTPDKGGVGDGWFVNRNGGRLTQMMSGLNSGFASAMYRLPDDKLTIVLLSNSEDSATHLSRIAHDLVAITFGEKFEMPKANVETKVDPRTLARFVGKYEFGPGRLITISRRDDTLYSQKGNEPSVEMFAESETRFFLKVADVRFEFKLDPKGAVTGVVVNANGQEMTGRKTD